MSVVFESEPAESELVESDELESLLSAEDESEEPESLLSAVDEAESAESLDLESTVSESEESEDLASEESEEEAELSELSELSGCRRSCRRSRSRRTRSRRSWRRSCRSSRCRRSSESEDLASAELASELSELLSELELSELSSAVRAVRGGFRRAHRGGFSRRRPRRRRHDDDDEYEPAQSGCQDRDPEGVGEQPGTQRSSDARHLPTRVQQAGDSIADCLAVSTTRGIEMISKAPIESGRDPPVGRTMTYQTPRSRRTSPPRLTSASRVTLRRDPRGPPMGVGERDTSSPLGGTGTATHHAVAVDLVVVTAVRSILRPTQAG